MSPLRIATAGAALVLLTAGNTVAQPTAPATGKPVSLLKILTFPDKTKIKPHGHRLGVQASKTHVAAVHQRPRHWAALATNATTRPDVWPAAEPIAATRVVAADAEQQGAATTAESAPNELVVGGRAIQVVSPDDANEIDLAADTLDVPANKWPRSDFTDRGVPAAEPSAVTVATAATAPMPDAAPVSSSAWIAQLLAAIGGAMAVASVAWFLIGSAPQRRYD